MTEPLQTQESFYQEGDWTPQEQAELNQITRIYWDRNQKKEPPPMTDPDGLPSLKIEGTLRMFDPEVPVVDLSQVYNAMLERTDNSEVFFPVVDQEAPVVAEKKSSPEPTENLPEGVEENTELDDLIDQLELHPELTPPQPTGQAELDTKNLRVYKHFIVVCGSRYYCDLKQFHRVMCIYLLRLKGPVLFISGAAPSGADDLIIRWCKKFGYPCLKMPANWDENGKSAGFIRNEAMSRIATQVLAFWDMKSPGTEHMVEVTVEKDKPVKIIHIQTPSKDRWYAMLRKREAQDREKALTQLSVEATEETHVPESLVQAYAQAVDKEVVDRIKAAKFSGSAGGYDQVVDVAFKERLRSYPDSDYFGDTPVVASAASEEDGDDDIPDASLVVEEEEVA